MQEASSLSAIAQMRAAGNGVDALKQEIAADLRLAAGQLEDHSNLLELGLDSMYLMSWLNRLRSRGYRLTLRELYQHPTPAGWHALLARAARVDHARQENDKRATLPTMIDGKPFPLTPVQHAYFVGRSPEQTLGGVGCHLYQEFDGTGLEPATLERAVQALIARHSMLSTAFRPDGTQQWQARFGWRGLNVCDLRALSEREVDARLLGLRARLDHRVLAVEKAETFDFHLCLLPENRHRLHVNFDLLVADAASFTLFFDELAALIQGQALPPLAADYDFCSYQHQVAQENAALRTSAQSYWHSRLLDLPPAPALPLAVEPSRLEVVRTTRRRASLSASRWQQFKQYAGHCGVTPTMALVTAFAAVLARWSNQRRLLLNLTLFDRLPLHPAVERMIADFTNILLLDLDIDARPFNELARRSQAAFTAAHEHRHYSGVEVLRDLRKQGGHAHGVPIVFTSNLGRDLFGTQTAAALGAPCWGISQTPQVWIDHLAYEHGDQVYLQWDSKEALFPPDLIHTLFDAYITLVHELIDNPDTWNQPLPDLLPQAQRDVRRRVNDTRQALPSGLLHEGFFAQAKRSPEAIAVIHGGRHLTYADLALEARRLAGTLRAQGVRAGECVAISMTKGIGQIIAVLGTLYAGAVYVPVSMDQPASRREKIYRDAGVPLVLTDAGERSRAEWLSGRLLMDWQAARRAAPLPEPVQVSADQLAYVIYTSGSTGEPKGVMISHRGAWNTCCEINRRYDVHSGDRVLALSALNFDLSVYDIFGLLQAGGALVLVDENQRRDPEAWCAAIHEHAVTLWNSVPALFDMLLTYAEGFDLDVPAALRAVLLSGDWIGLDLPERYRNFRKDGAFIAMGGATEASIWSNVYDVTNVPAHWRSIPYGYPLANQKYRVVDDSGRDCPDWAPGELWIGGSGIALGYCNDPERTAQRFVELDGDRWYRTGDLGCYWPDGTLEFLGRRDKQAKVGGHRVELGEIEVALQRVPGVRAAVVMALGEREKSLAAFVVAEPRSLCRMLQADAALPENYASLLAPQAAMDEVAATEPDRLVAAFLSEHFARLGVLVNDATDLESCAKSCDVRPKYRMLLGRWLKWLTAQGSAHRDSLERRPREAETPAARNTPPALREIANALATFHEPLARIMRGEQAAESLLDHPQLAPEALALYEPNVTNALDALVGALATLSRKLGRPVQLIDFGARSAKTGEHLLRRLTTGQLIYIAMDESPEMVQRARARLAQYPHAEAVRVTAAGDWRHRADVVLANNSLHRSSEPAASVQTLASLGAPGALIYVLEFAALSPLALLTADVLEATSTEPTLRAAEEWLALFAAAALDCEQHARFGSTTHAFVLRAPREIAVPDGDRLRTELARELPAYMIPPRIQFLDSLPLTPNGKIDHQALRALCAATEISQARLEPPRGAAEELLAGLWRTWLDLPQPHRYSDFFRSGGDSLLATRLMAELAQRGFSASLGELYSASTLSAFAATLRRGSEQAAPALLIDSATRHEPFALTDMQQAYLVGRQPGFPLSGVGAHFYVELNVRALDIPRFEAVWRRLIERHDMLRAVVREGKQLILRQTPPFVLQRHSLDSLEGAAAQALRARLSHQALDPAQWPLFDIQLATDAHGNGRLYVSLDNLMLDGLSMQILLAELEELYVNPAMELPPIEMSFRDYLLYRANRPEPRAAREYWLKRLDSLPPAPQLPLARDPAASGVPRFIRLSRRISAPAWQSLKKRAAAQQLTPSTLLLNAYGAVLSAWSSRADLTLNLTLFDREPVHPHIERILGDFTSLLLIAWEPGGTWLESAQRLQRRVWEDLAHRELSGIRVMRALAQRAGAAAAAMPVVFTSALGFDKGRFLPSASWLSPHWGISQTPQVWLDHQVYESDGELHFNWDAVEGLFAPDMLQAMFAQYAALLLRLAEEPSAWQRPLALSVPRIERNAPPSPAQRPPPRAPEQVAAPNERVLEQVRELFLQVIGKPIAQTQNFFEAGASSLHLVQLHVHLQRAGHANLAVTDLFEHPTPSTLAACLSGDEPEPSTDSHQRRELLEQRKARRERRTGTPL